MKEKHFLQLNRNEAKNKTKQNPKKSKEREFEILNS
jgi:hypothetical protein